MRQRNFWMIVLAGAGLWACARSPRGQPEPQPSGPPRSPAPVVSSTPAAPTPTAPATAGAPGDSAPRRRARPNPVVQDSIRRATVAQLLTRIAGREQEPAGAVFKNVQLLKDMPAAAFLRNMDENYGRGLGMVCANCHVPDQWDADTKKNKRIALDMQRMTTHINTQQLTTIKELDADFHPVTCVTCHRGTGHPETTMPVPPPPAPGASPGRP